MAEPILEVKGLKTYFYTEEGVLPGVDGLDFTLEQGKVLAIVGESGCGKSVTSLSILRIVQSPPGRIIAGEILYNGKDLLKLSERDMRKIRGNDISMIFQEPMTSLNPVFTVGQQIMESLTLHQGMTKKQARARAVEMLTLVGIPTPERIVDEYPHQLSGGMRQRVMIAMALACNPKILIADEPTTALDVTIQAQILRLIAQGPYGRVGYPDHARPWRCGRDRQRRYGHVRRRGRRIRRRARAVQKSPAPVYRGTFAQRARHGAARRRALQHSRHGPKPQGLSGGLPVLAALRPQRRPLPHGAPAAV